MIFVTVGTDLPFDRLIRVVDEWAGASGRKDVFAQIGETDLAPRNIQYSKFLEPPQFVERFSQASTIVAHAGMGTILSALRYQKPIVVMPRRATLGEQRNEHQLATARRLSDMGKITVAMDEVEMRQMLDRLSHLTVKDKIGSHASPELISGIKTFIHSPGRHREPEGARFILSRVFAHLQAPRKAPSKIRG